MKGQWLLFISILVFISSCKVTETSSVDPEVDETIVIVADTTNQQEEVIEVAVYKAERTRHFKLHHTRLEVSFDWHKQHLEGIATLKLEPYFYDQSYAVIDAKGMDIHEVSLIKGEQVSSLRYEYNGEKLSVDLGRTYKNGEFLNLKITYTARPNEGEHMYEQVAEKGLHFINPLNNEKGKPQQIWTHGETDTNSRWFPTLDAPNQKSTQEIFITVDQKFNTLSNGSLIYARTNPDGTRTDYWKMDQPHAPYLFMMAIGDFAVVEDEWNGKKVDYFVEPEYEPYARAIFGNTPEMMSFFSDKLNYPYPWDKYSQVVVRDFVSGAMENTTASVFMEDLNVDNRELLDYDWDDIIAHELVHQWFGNLVTCESWANLPLNESFATYGEYLWKSHKYGLDEGAYVLYSELDKYLNEAERKKEDLIRFYYDDDEEMFDSHSYAKGGLILHILRNYLGDEAFFKSLEFYLNSNAFGKAEIHELRLAFEHISGEDLNWFFNQWFLASGHPKLRIEEVMENDKFIVKVWQEQDLDAYPVYKLPLTLDIWEKGRKVQYLIEIDRPYQEFEFENIERPDLVLVDSDFILVGEKKHSKSMDAYQYQFNKYEHNIRARIEALEYFLANSQDSLTQTVLSNALQDPFWVIREEVLYALENDSSDFFSNNEKLIKIMAREDPNPLVKAAAIGILASRDKQKYIDIFRANLYDSSYSVAGQALYGYLQSGAEDATEVAEKFASETNFNLTSPIADFYIKNLDYNHYDWFTDKIKKYTGADLWYFTKLFGMYLVSAPESQAIEGIKTLEFIAINSSQFYNRLSAYQSLELLSDYEGVPEILSQIKSNEKDARLLEYYKQ